MIARITEDPALIQLRTRLLNAGGTGVAFDPEALAFIRDLLDQGRFFSGGAAVRPLSAPPPGNTRVIAGYALNRPDSQWRRYTWGLLDAEILDPGIPHHLYYGFPLLDGRRNRSSVFETDDALTPALHVERVHRALMLGEQVIESEETPWRTP